MIEDLDGGDGGPSRAPAVRVISVALALATAIGWAALQSPALRGPYATPDPRGGVTFSPRPSAGTLTILDAAALQPAVPVIAIVSPDGCLRIQQTRTGHGFVGDRAITVVRVFPTPPPEVQTFTVVTSSGPVVMWRTCQPALISPVWRFAP